MKLAWIILAILRGNKAPADRTEEVVNLAEEVAVEARALNSQLKPLADSPDPITALMIQLYQQRERNAAYARLLN